MKTRLIIAALVALACACGLGCWMWWNRPLCVIRNDCAQAQDFVVVVEGEPTRMHLEPGGQGRVRRWHEFLVDHVDVMPVGGNGPPTRTLFNHEEACTFYCLTLAIDDRGGNVDFH